MSAAERVDARGFDAAAIAAAVARLRAGGLVAFPTETVWGLGADAGSDAAMAALRRWKGRDAAQPVSLLVAGPEAVAALGLELPPAARRLAAAFWPGPLTLVVPAPPGRFAAGVARGDGAVGLRCSPHPAAAALAAALAAAGAGPLTATSLNRSGAPPARTRADAERLCAGADAPWCLTGAAEAGGGAPSSVVDCTAAPPRLLRAGALARADLERALEQETAVP